MIRLDWKLTLIKQINESLDSEPSEFNGTNLTNFRSIKFVGKIDYNNQIYLYSLNEKGAPGLLFHLNCKDKSDYYSQFYLQILYF